MPVRNAGLFPSVFKELGTLNHRGTPRNRVASAVAILSVGLSSLGVVFLLLGIQLLPTLVGAQTTHGLTVASASSPRRAEAISNSDTNSFQQAVRKSGLIFDGVVKSVVRESNGSGAPLAYRISFQVREGFRGVRSGSVLTIREWAGLWTGGDTHEPRYRIGERSIVFFYPPRGGGLTSPVGGSKGKLAVSRLEFVVLPSEWAFAALSSYATASVDRDRSGSNQIPLRVLAERIRLAEAN